MSATTPPPDGSGGSSTRYRVSRCRVCDEPIAATGTRGPRREICDRPRCRHIARADAYLEAVVRELERAGLTDAAGHLWELRDWYGYARRNVPK